MAAFNEGNWTRRTAMRTVTILVVVLASLCGCQQVMIVTQPSGARVYIGAVYQGNTPVRTMLPTNRPHTVELKMPGYRTHAVNIARVKRKPLMDPSLGNASLGLSYLNMLAGHPAGLIVSLCGRVAVDEYNYELVPNRIDVELKPL